MNALALLLSLALAAAPHSKLGGYFGDSGAADSRMLLAACPRLAVFALPDSSAVNAIATLAASCPDTQVVVRVGVTSRPAPRRWPRGSDPGRAARAAVSCDVFGGRD